MTLAFLSKLPLPPPTTVTEPREWWEVPVALTVCILCGFLLGPLKHVIWRYLGRRF